MRRLRRWLLAAAAVVLILASAAVLVLRSEIRGSLPVLTGEIPVAGLSAAVHIDRDRLGVPDIRGRNRRDVAVALGFLHGQERFFQMDLLRRSAAGELAALVGETALPQDRANRLHRFRSHAREMLAGCSSRERALLTAYTAGVNAGLTALRTKPFEYLLLRAEPLAWREEDCFLVLYAMFCQLNLASGFEELQLGTLFDVLPRELADFLAPAGSTWEAPVEGQPARAGAPPGPEVLDLRRSFPASDPADGRAATPGGFPTIAADHELDGDGPPAAGSNAWALAAWRTAGHAALLANDMHLGLMVPNIWFRAALSWFDETRAEQRRLAGVTLPGMPALVAGSNGHCAWGFSNSYCDWIDLVVVKRDPSDTTRYLAPGASRPFTYRKEIIAVNGGRPDTVRIRETIWGPILQQDHRGRLLALRWTAHDSLAVNLRLIELEEARTVDAILDVAPLCGIPAQNLVCADADGHIGWTIAGRIPRRVGFSGRLPVSWADGSARWDGWLPADAYPRIEDPPGGAIWTANARVIDAAGQVGLGDGGFDIGGRARQIRDDLDALPDASEADMLAVQLDDRALFLERWRTIILEQLRPETVAGDSLCAEFRRLVRDGWTGRADVGSVGYRLVRAFRLQLFEEVYGWLTAPCRQADPAFDFHVIPRWEDPLWTLVNQRPPHLLSSHYASWDSVFVNVADEVVRWLNRDGRPLVSRTWGEFNTTAIRHPLSRAVPLVGRWLDMPAHQLPGDSHMPRVQHPAMGASERLVVAPGRPEQGILQMPCGQSGHPLSPYWRAGHQAWEEGRPTPLLPGEPRWRLLLRPR